MKKAFDNKKLMLGLLTMVVILAIVIVSSFWPFILDFSKIGTEQFITDQMIIITITIAATVSMMLIAQASNAANPNSEIAKSKVAFMISIANIVNHTAFYQWVKKVLQTKDRKDIAEREMLSLGVPFDVFFLNKAQICSLIVPTKINNTFYQALSKEQINAILRLKKYVANVKFVSPNYYTSFKSWMADKNLSEIASGVNKKKVLTIIFQLSLKILLSFIFASILASLVRDLTQEGGSSAQAWMRFLSRIFAYITSSFLGYNIGCKMNDLDAFYIMKRVEAHTLYCEDKTFVYVDEAKEEYEKFYNLKEDNSNNG